jgi:amidase
MIRPMRTAARVCAATVLSIAAAAAQGRTFDLLTASVEDIQAAVGSGALSYERLVRLYLARIDAYDKRGPRLNAIIEINPRAIETARALDEERRSSGVRGPLHGIPIAIKDNIDGRAACRGAALSGEVDGRAAARQLR